MDGLAAVVDSAVIVGIGFGIPVVILSLLGLQAYQAEGNEFRAKAIGLVPEGPRSTATAVRLPVGRCWEDKDCPTATRACCPAHLHQHLPCWLARKVGGKLRSECLDCARFLLPASRGKRESAKGGY